MNDHATTGLHLDVKGEQEIFDPTPQQIKAAIESITLEGERFIILDKEPSGMTHMQALLEDDSSWTLEFQDGSLEEHFQAAGLSRERVTEMFLAFTGGNEIWRSSVKWERIAI